MGAKKYDLQSFKEACILIVDDEPEICELASEHLVDDGFETVLLAGNGAEALKIIQSRQVDLVLADLLMPEMNGMELYNELQKSEYNCRFVMISGSDLEDVSPKPTNKVELIQKPFDFPKLVERVNKICLTL